MTSVAIATDTSACLPDAAIGRAGLFVLPIGLVVAGRRLSDGPHAWPEVHRALAVGDPVLTTSPSPVDYLQAVDAAGGSMVIVTPAAELAVMHRNAVLAARLACSPVEVVDTRTAAAGHGLAVLAGLDAIEAGADLAGVAAAVRAVSARVRMVAAVPARASGPNRCAPGAAASPAGGAPHDAGQPQVFEIHDGAIVPVGAPAGSDPIEIMARTWHRSMASSTGSRRTAVFHNGDGPGAARLRADLSGDAMLVPVSPALAVHLGPACVGVAWHEHVAP
ncbi:MAG: DegV family protein [Actinomycetota bacterium]|nr:DegV family protein [Actinomycetota bacterium]MDA8280591.1 DegV family protein [Actinomycetota bacterium]